MKNGGDAVVDWDSGTILDERNVERRRGADFQGGGAERSIYRNFKLQATVVEGVEYIPLFAADGEDDRRGVRAEVGPVHEADPARTEARRTGLIHHRSDSGSL